jgi:lipopolysaccharide/colanic/teichoic acid biosynthesis glycosyltransferase
MVRATGNEAIAVEGDLKKSLSASNIQGYLRVKRLLDIVGSSLILLVMLIPFLIIGLIIYLFSPGPIVYKSQRYGRNGEIFNFLKFRSMYVDADAKQAQFEKDHNEKDGAIFKMKNDPRITPIGRFMRRFSIDELPQLINVFLGDMSLIGPRPLPIHQGDKLTESERQRMNVPQGMSCYWQVMGRSDLSFQEMIELDMKYAREIGFGTDLKIIWLTPLAVLTGKGAY